ncbi:hypothetical protein U9M48_030218 [Paspalum notatum var. saurae]|uniref:DUF1618 domain-containing protein n=1 Tax=Paspalum notatum var. saurae TaxID=547442 RepID=A0AAQ3U377_PASNO
MSMSNPPATPTPQLDCLLLNVHAYAGERRNATTTSGFTRKHQIIEVSLCPARPPLPSDVFVRCPEIRFTVLPRVVRAVEDLFLLRVAIDCEPDCISSPDDSDYFVYRAGCVGTKRDLERLSHPVPFSHDDDVGLLSRGDHYTVAALIASGTLDVFDLHLFHSESKAWIYRKVSVGEPQRAFPLVIPENCQRLLYHDTSTVITIGGEGGTMGWVDLWRGIFFCDVLCDKPMLRGVPLPFPVELVSCNNGRGAKLGCPKLVRGIAFIKRGTDDNADDCLKLVHLEANATCLPGTDDETGYPFFFMNSWAIVTWSNTKMTSSWKDWHMDCRVQASDITMDSQIKSKLLQFGLLPARDDATAVLGLQNLLISDPAPDISAADGDVVYLMARRKFMHSKACVLTIDLRNYALVDVAEFDTERQPGVPALYFPSTISKYMNVETSQLFDFVISVWMLLHFIWSLIEYKRSVLMLTSSYKIQRKRLWPKEDEDLLMPKDTKISPQDEDLLMPKDTKISQETHLVWSLLESL